MEITREAVEKRLAMLKHQKDEMLQQIENLSANVNAYNGAIQDCEHWLQQLAKEAKKDEETHKLTKVE